MYERSKTTIGENFKIIILLIKRKYEKLGWQKWSESHPMTWCCGQIVKGVQENQIIEKI